MTSLLGDRLSRKRSSFWLVLRLRLVRITDVVGGDELRGWDKQRNFNGNESGTFLDVSSRGVQNVVDGYHVTRRSIPAREACAP